MTTHRKIQAGVAAVIGVGLAASGAALAAHRHQPAAPSASSAPTGSFVSAGTTAAGTHGFGRGHHGPGGDIADAAAYLGITEVAIRTALESGRTLAQIADATSGKSAAGLIDALVAVETKEINAAVAAKKLTQAQADKLLAGLKAHETAEVNGTIRGHHGGPGGPGHHGHGLDAAAAYLGVTDEALRTSLMSGKTLAQIAEATAGKSKAGLIAALVAAEQKELAAAVTAGRLTQAQADSISSGLQARVTDLDEGKLPPRGDHHRGGPPSFGAPPAGTGGTHI
jgi:hypothetical protein